MSTISEPVCIEGKKKKEGTLPGQCGQTRARRAILDNLSLPLSLHSPASRRNQAVPFESRRAPLIRGPRQTEDLNTLAVSGSCTVCFVRTCFCAEDLSNQLMHLRRRLRASARAEIKFVTEGHAKPGREGHIVNTRHYKTAKATAKKALLLPIIISALSVDNQLWLPAARQI